ncbi:shikimate kinase [Bdellovibrio reynosensis]|uniref:Shikimate synthase n=1 Tax=Bdellovibrio reynosensis TaxID=2835041 RepID=A0ABY4CAQ5_9BACT|nr:shikimate kinase [Bdellovibrio reynosensis]UOF00766.1 shikimate synthase [Bdellovibrio reynosensis]
MITAVVGHRGTGKSELMKRLQIYLRDQNVDFVDLDEEIEKKIGKSIGDLFFDHGEDYFRELERQLFLETLQKPQKDMYLVLGAGFDLSVIPESVRVLWVKRITDLDGRIFLNRPRLNPEVSPIEEYQKRGVIREEKYKNRADEVYLMPEGIFENHHHAMTVEKSVLTHTYLNVGGAITVLSEHILNEHRWQLFKNRFANKGISYFELRDDLLSPEQIQKALTELPGEEFIYSFRLPLEGSFPTSTEILQKAKWVDWAWELGKPDELLKLIPAEKVILSLHDGRQFYEWSGYESKIGHLKFAPEVNSYSELLSGHQWQKENDKKRSYLPRSKEGRWEWYRLLQKGHQEINFWREGDGTASDQPSLWKWLANPELKNKFAAVLGDPVRHSYTPVEQSDFFNRKNVPVYAVSIRRDEWDEAFPILTKLGLGYAAVTAPHKEHAAEVVTEKNLQAINTLFFDETSKTWKGTSTDEQGFFELIEGVGMIAPLQKHIFVWGGGGTLEMIKKAIPHATYFSSRSGKPRDESFEVPESPKVLVWAAPRSIETLMPPLEWKPAMVFDLNYKEDSPGREYAQLCAANYQSGLTMFTAQAQGQRTFWKKCEE